MTVLPNDDPAASAIADVYRGPVEDFVRRRDALAKELRTAGDRDGAAIVKSLRKPTRTAWALNLGVQENAGAIAALVDAVAAVLDAQATGVDVRSAITGMRTAVRELADVAAREAQQSGHRVESGVLTNAVLAVLGSPESFEQLRGGCLVDIPEAGGLDFLASLPAPVSASRPAPKESEADASQARPEQETGNDSAAREAMQQAARVLAGARENSASAQRDLAEAGTRVAAAEERLRRAEEEAREAQQLLERVRDAADAAAAQLRAAEANAAEIERRVSTSERS